LSFAPLDDAAGSGSRVPELLPYVVGLGEHPTGNCSRIPLAELAVGCDGARIYLASRSVKRPVEQVLPHALDPRARTPRSVHFLAEISRAQAAVITKFDWRTADCLPFLPRIRYWRTIVSPARWILDVAELPAKSAPWPQWRAAFHRWSER